jgi:hypothetical protein
MPAPNRSSPPRDPPAPHVKDPSRQDTVPCLRLDLLVARGAVPGQFEVRDPRGGGTLVLDDVELSVARMFDGRRRLAEVLENADRLGIPADLDGLTRFIHSLERLHFLAPRGTVARGGSRSRPPRKPWDARTRERFQGAMKLVRSGRPDEAVPTLLRLLTADPGNVEAQELLSLVVAGHTLAASPIGELLATRHRPGRITLPVGWGRALLLAAGVVALAGLLAWGLWPRGTEPGAPRSRAAAPPAPASALRTGPIDRRWHPLLGELRAPAAGLLRWREPLPSQVVAGERLGEIRAAAEPAEPGPEARRRLEELERLAAADPVYEEFLEKERATLSGQVAAGRSFGLAPARAGTLSILARAETRVARGDLVARLLDGETWHLAASVTGEAPRTGADCEVAGDGAGERATGRVLEAIPGDGRQEVICVLSADLAPWLERARAPSLRLP